MDDSTEAEQRPIHTEDEAREEASWMARDVTSIAVISIAVMLLLVLALWATTDVAGQGSDPWPYVVAFVAVLAVAVAAFVWSRHEP